MSCCFINDLYLFTIIMKRLISIHYSRIWDKGREYIMDKSLVQRVHTYTHTIHQLSTFWLWHHSTIHRATLKRPQFWNFANAEENYPWSLWSFCLAFESRENTTDREKKEQWGSWKTEKKQASTDLPILEWLSSKASVVRFYEGGNAFKA